MRGDAAFFDAAAQRGPVKTEKRAEISVKR